MSNRSLYSHLFYIFAIEGALSVIWLLLIPSEDRFISIGRLLLICAIAFPSLFFIYLGYSPPKNIRKLERPEYILAFLVFSLALSVVLFALRYANPEKILPYFERLRPLLLYGILVFFQFFICLLYSSKGFHLLRLAVFKPTYVSVITVFVFLLGVFSLVATTRLGVTFDPAYWGEPGVPILGWQFALVLITGGGVYYLAFYLQKDTLDIVLPITIYICAALVWLSVPMDIVENSFYMPITAPTYDPLPYSDSIYYDQMAQSLLIGHPYLGVIPLRPLYIFLLTIFHMIMGENYSQILIAQTLVMAFIPVILYFLGRKLHSSVAGISVAFFFIFRELTSLLVSSNTRVTNARMILTDLPTLLMLLISCLFMIRWLESQRKKDAFVSGGVFGLLLLFRTQSVLIFPFVAIVAFLILSSKQEKTFLKQILIVLAGLAITLLPWGIHNYIEPINTESNVAFQTNFFGDHYVAFGNIDRASYDFEGKGPASVLLEIAIKDPKHVFWFISNHFLAIQVNSIMAFPLFEVYNGLFEPINLYWVNWDGQLAWYNSVLVVFYLMVIAFGIGATWRRWRWIALLPLCYSVGYATATAIARFSSWRYDFPSDWIAYFYFCIGFAELLRYAVILFGGDDKFVSVTKRQNIKHRNSLGKFFTLSLIFAFVGSIPWAIKGLFSMRYPDQTREFLLAKIEMTDYDLSREELSDFLSQEDAFIQVGRLLYPRYFFADKGLISTNPSPAYASREYPRFGFYLLNENSMAIVFPSTIIVNPFPHAEDVIVLGCQYNDYVEARLIVFPELGIFYTGLDLTEPCLP